MDRKFSHFWAFTSMHVNASVPTSNNRLMVRYMCFSTEAVPMDTSMSLIGRSDKKLVASECFALNMHATEI